METNKSYDKYYLEINPATGYVVEKDGKPVLGKLAKSDCRLEPRMVKTLNIGWQNSGVFFIEVKPVVKPVVKPKSDARLALEAEAIELEIKFRDNIGSEKLQVKINEAKK